MINIIV